MTTTSKLNLSLNASHIHYTHHFLRRCQVQVLDTFRYAANKFYSKIFFYCLLWTFNIRILKAYLHYKFTVQRVNKASLFEVTELQEVARTSKGFIMLRLARVLRQQYSAQCFGKIPGFNLWNLSGVFPPFVGHFFKRAREPEVTWSNQNINSSLAHWSLYVFMLNVLKYLFIVSCSADKVMLCPRTYIEAIRSLHCTISPRGTPSNAFSSHVLCCAKAPMKSKI